MVSTIALIHRMITKQKVKNEQIKRKQTCSLCFRLFQPNSSNPCQILKSLKYSPFDSLIDNRKFQKFQLHSPSHSDFMAI